MLSSEVIGRGFENLQLDCEVAGGAPFNPCPAALAATEAISLAHVQGKSGYGTGQAARNQADLVGGR